MSQMEKCAQCASQSNLRQCTGCLEVWYCSRDCQTKHWNQHRTTCTKITPRTADKEAKVSEGRDRCSHCGSRCPKLRRCMGCLAVWYCSAECQGRHWPQHRSQCSTSKGRESNGKLTVETCVQCASQSNLRRCTGCLKVWYCSKECQKQHWGLHNAECKKKQFPATYTKEAFLKAISVSDLAEGPSHHPVHVNSRKAKVAWLSTEGKRLAHLRNEICRLIKQRDDDNDDDDVIVTPIMTWERARSRASRLFPGKRIVDVFRELNNDKFALPRRQNVVSISRIKGPYDHLFRVAGYVQDFEGKSVLYMICYNQEDPEPYFRYDQLVEGNFFCIDHAYLHIFADRSVGFRVDYPWHVLIMEP